MQSAAVLRPLSQTRKVEGSICIRRLSQSPSVALGDSSRHVSLPSGLSLEARSVNKRDGESLCIVRSAVMEGSSSWDGDSWSIVSTKSYRFLCNSMSPCSRKNVYGGESIGLHLLFQFCRLTLGLSRADSRSEGRAKAVGVGCR